MTPARADFEKYVLEVIDIMDPSKFNHKLYVEKFSKMSDKMFDEWVDLIEAGEEKLYLYAPNMKVTLQVRDLLAAAKFIGLELFERIKMWDSTTRRYYTTRFKYLVLKLPVRRLKQYLQDGLSVPDSDRKINPTSGQVIKPDKGSTISLTEAQTMDSKGLSSCLVELTNVRGGNLTAYAGYRAALEETGEASINEIDMTEGIRSAEVARVQLQAMHIDNNL